MLAYRIIKSIKLCGIQSVSSRLQFSSKSGRKTLKKLKPKTSLAPKFVDNVKLWPDLLAKEIEEEHQRIAGLIEKREKWETMEERGFGMGNLSIIHEFHDPIQGKLHVFSKYGLEDMKWLRTGVPIEICKLDDKNKMQVLTEGYVAGTIGPKIQVTAFEPKKLEDKSCKYFLIPSTRGGAITKLRELLKNPETLSTDSVHLVNLAYRSISMSSIHDPKIRSLDSTTLTESQKAAVSAALNQKRNLLCIQGPPGTGKTHVIAEIVANLMKKGRKVIVCAPTHVAVRNALKATEKRLLEHMDKDKIAEKLVIGADRNENFRNHPLYNELVHITKLIVESPEGEAKNRLQKTAANLKWQIWKDVFAKKQVVFTTISNSLVQRLPEYSWNASVIIVDESAQCTEPMTWLPVLTTPTCQKLILVGDQKQLPSIVLTEYAKQGGLNISLMEKLANDFANNNINILLKEQFRMNEKIMNWSNQVFYEDQLIAHESVKDITLADYCSNLELENPLNSPILMINMDDIRGRSKENRSQTSFINEDEMHVISKYISGLTVHLGIYPENIAVIAPYYAQIEQLRKKVLQGVGVNTVDAYQGHEREVVIFSLVRDNVYGALGFLNETRRLNVAITRAKRQFVLIGSAQMLQKNEHLKLLYKYLKSEKVIFTPEFIDKFHDLKLPSS